MTAPLRRSAGRRHLAFGVMLAFALAATSQPALAQYVAPSADPSAVPAGDAQALIARLKLPESAKPVREMVPGWKKPTKIVVQSPDSAAVMAWLQEAAPGVELIPVAKLATAAQADGADAFVGFCPTAAQIASDKALRWIQLANAGLNGCAAQPPLLLTNMQHFFGNQIAEHVIGLTLGLARGLDLLIRQNQNEAFINGRYSVPEGKLWEIEGRTMLVVGLGGIGTNVAEKAHAMGMKVIATRNSSHDGPAYVDYVGLSGELPALIGKADVVVSTLPLTNDTRGLFNAAMFARMKKGALFINVGRGEEVVNDDLIAALASGQVGGAGLDATDPTLLPPHHPLFRAKNIIITPHSASDGVGVDGSFIGQDGSNYWLLLKEQLRRYVAGEKIFSVVDIARGY